MVLKKHWKIFLRLQKLGLMKRMIYRKNFFLVTFAVMVQIFLNLIFINLIFHFIGNLAGWTYFETLLVYGTYFILEGLLWVLFGNLSAINEHVRNGMLDSLMIKPIKTQFLISFWRSDPEDFARVVIGIGAIFYAVSHLNLSFLNLIFNFFLYFLLLINALIIVYSINLFLKTMNIWTISGRAFFSLTNTILNTSQYPIDIFYHKLVRTFFTFFIPLAIITSFPAKILSNGFDAKIVLISLTLGITFFIGSRKFFRFALSKYESASS